MSREEEKKRHEIIGQLIWEGAEGGEGKGPLPIIRVRVTGRPPSPLVRDPVFPSSTTSVDQTLLPATLATNCQYYDGTTSSLGVTCHRLCPRWPRSAALPPWPWGWGYGRLVLLSSVACDAEGQAYLN